jgi:hypothetical protein
MEMKILKLIRNKHKNITSSKNKDETDSDDEYKDIDIKKKLKEYKKEHPGERFPIELINEAVRWRLN